MGRRRYTEEQFREAVADPTVTTIAELCRRLGIVPRGGNYASLRSLARRLGIELDGVLASRPTRIKPGRWRAPWTAVELERAIHAPNVRSLVAVYRVLGVRPRTEAYRRIRAVADEQGLDIAHLLPPTSGRPFEGLGVPSEDVADAVRHASTRDEVLELLRLKPTRRNRQALARTVQRHDIPVGHLRPRRVPQGSRTGGRPRRALSEILQRDTQVTTSTLRKRLIEEGIFPRRCEACGRATWRGQQIPLELDHIDGDRRNNLIENLRLLCPNCHALTPTYRGRNIGRRPTARGRGANGSTRGS